MTNSWLFWVVVTAASFAYPLITRATGASPTNVAFWCVVGGVVPVALHKLFSKPESLELSQTAWLFVSGLLLGIGMIGYGKIISTPDWPLSIVIPVMAVIMAAVLVAGGMIFYGETLSAKQVIGLVLTFGGIWLLN